MNRSQLVIVIIAMVVLVSVIGLGAMLVTGDKDSEKLSVVASFYPLGYMASAIGGDKVEVSTLIPHNTEVHSWQPSASDILLADSADVLLYNGAGLDQWVEDDLLLAIDTGNKLVVETTHGLELIDGSHGHHDHGDNGTQEGAEEDHHLADPHTWISPFTARQQAEAIYLALVEADPDNSSYFATRWSELNATLTALDLEYAQRLEARQWDAFFVTHAAYGYMCHRYGLEQEAIIGIDADEQPSSSTIADLADRMIEEGIRTIYLNPVFSDDYAMIMEQEVERQTGEAVTVLKLYIMTGPFDELDYLQQMETNLDNLAHGLGAE